MPDATSPSTPTLPGGAPASEARIHARADVGQIADMPEYILQRLVRAAGNAVDLRVVTVVGDVAIGNIDGAQDSGPVPRIDGAQVSACTSVNLLTGDIVNAMHRDFMQASDPTLRDFHAKQVELSRQIVADNLKTVAEIVDRLWSKIAAQSSPTG